MDTTALIAAIRVAEHVQRLPDPGPAPARPLVRFAANIPGAADAFDAIEPDLVVRAVDDAEQLFDSPLRAAPRTGT